MVRPPVLNVLDQLEEFAIEEDESFNDLLRLLNFSVVVRREDDRQRRFRRVFEHVLAFLIEACRNGVVLLEDNQQGRQRWGVVGAVSQVFSGLRVDAREGLDAPQSGDPRSERAVAVLEQEAATLESFVPMLERLANALRQTLLDLGKLVLLPGLLFLLLRPLAQLFLSHQGIVVVVDTHDTIDGTRELPVERGPQPSLFLLQGVKRLAHFEIAAVPRVDEDREFTRLKATVIAVPLDDVGDLQVVLEIPFEQVQPLVGDRLPDHVLHEAVSAAARVAPMGGPADSAAYKAGAEIVKEFGVNLVLVGSRHILEGGESLTESSGECLYASGGGAPGWASGLSLPGPPSPYSPVPRVP